MNTVESLQALVDKGIIGKCEKHGEVVYFDALLLTCPECAETPPIKGKKKPSSLIKANPIPEVKELTEEEKEAIAAKKKRKRYIIIGAILVVVFWLFSNCNAIVSYFK
jgi:hypothetical protein